MVKINFLDNNNNLKEIEANENSSLLEVSKKNNINLEGSCGGEMLCSTCHIYILSNHIDKLKKQNDEEKEILALTKNLKKNSRLACQIKITNKLKGLIFSVA
tara:strand:- start:210 stop:515 length:306 start_codon:yes stop_codon:yes gene_type:complete